MLPSGVPRLDQYDELLGSETFDEMRRFADAFLTQHGGLLGSYRRRWVHDPLHQWSRQWEYPYARERVRAAIAKSTDQPARVLDAGSGVTFFPFFVADTMGAEVTCVDSDPALEPIFDALHQHTRTAVSFCQGDLRRIPFPDRSFDAAYCLSVLEHTREYPAILAELRRVLRGGGTLVVTFDISLDGDSDIPLHRTRFLIEAMAEVFAAGEELQYSRLVNAARSQDAVTSVVIARRDRTLMPWAGPWVCVLKALRRARLPKQFGYTRLTFACYSLRSPVDAATARLGVTGNQS